MSEFETACKSMEKVDQNKLSNEEKLEIYGLYKQAIIGDVNTQRPGMFDMKGKAKWDAWSKVKGTSQDDAKTQYVTLANKYAM